jgi:hypothetical protein
VDLDAAMDRAYPILGALIASRERQAAPNTEFAVKRIPFRRPTILMSELTGNSMKLEIHIMKKIH